jgi:hypothetical protein
VELEVELEVGWKKEFGVSGRESDGFEEGESGR